MDNFKNENYSVIVISAINFFEGGPLSILKDCLTYLNNSAYPNSYKILALVHKKSLLDISLYGNISFMEFPKSRKSYLWRIYYEYYYFKKKFAKQNIKFWLALHDITPNIGNFEQAVYCHNPSPFNKLSLKDLYLQPILFLFTIFYKYLYQINIKKNKFVIVQQAWIKDEFVEMFKLNKNKVVISKPKIPKISEQYLNHTKTDNVIFIFPTLPRPFKNIEIICQAVKLLTLRKLKDFKVIITIDGSENSYSSYIVRNYGKLKNIDFVGLLPREHVFNMYGKSSCLIFPSKLETWGLPISEYKQYNKPIIVADLPYARETVWDYQNVSFFNENSAVDLAFYMQQVIEGKDFKNEKNQNLKYEQPFTEDWDELFNLLIS